MARAARRPGNLPAEVTTFVGRRRELAELRTKLSTVRVVSLTGPGGVGKTRLAIRIANDLARGFRDGAWLVGLAEVQDPALVGHAVVAALGLRDYATEGTAALLRSFLADKELLLVVDNCEHVLDAAAQLVTAIVEAVPDVRVVTTSREPLSIPAEHVLPVPPLLLPPGDVGAPVQELRQNEAVMLFTQRAEAASGAFELTAANQAAVVGLCRRLDGLPLAIELAAVRTRLLSPEQILQHLTDRFSLLAAAGRAALPRHQTLRTTLDWSHDLLDPDERTLFRRLSVFAGRFTLDDVEGACAGDDLPAARVLDLLSSLVDKSLVSKEDAQAVAGHRLHESTREYARLKLQEAGEDDVLAKRFTAYYVAWCHHCAPEARYRIVEWLAWLDLEIDNLRAVLQGCLSCGDVRTGTDLAASLGWYWITRATTEGVHWLDQLLAAATADATDSTTHAGAHFMRGFLAVLQADPATAGPELERAATAVARDDGQGRLLAESLSMGSIATNMSGDRASGRRLLRQARAAVTGLDDLPARLALLQAQAFDAFCDGDLDTFRSASSEGARLSRRAGDLYTLQVWLMNQGFAVLIAHDGDPEPLLSEALRIADQLDDRLAQSYLIAALACHAAGTGEPRLAATLFGACDVLRTETGASVNAILAPPLAAATKKTRDTLGRSTYDAQYETGRRYDRDTAVRLALHEPPRRPASAPPDRRPSPLTARETQVAHLLADGLSNKQIGTRLFISERTVENHIRNIMNKLGFTSRTQVAGWFAESGE